jgi:putative membrane protein
MKVNLLIYALALGVALNLSHTARAQDPSRDHLFVRKAATGGLTEVELGKIAVQNGDTQDVKDFGQKMVTDHTKINDNLQAIAAKDALTLPDNPNATQQALIDQLTRETGKTFDDDYIHTMINAHVADKALFTEEQANAKNPDLKQFASDSLPIITMHLQMIEGIAQTHGLPTNVQRGGTMSSTMTASRGSGMAPQ